MRKPLNIAGQRFGRLVAQAPAGRSKNRMSKWACACDCGNTAEVRIDLLRRGLTKSCGCLVREVSSKLLTAHNTVHGHAKNGEMTTEYKKWRSVITRCDPKYADAFPSHAGRGIAVCDRWQTFENFLADMGPFPGPGYTIERINNDGNYEPGNCRWATMKEQMRNTSRTRFVEHDGRRQCFLDWCAETGVDQRTARKRIARGWTIKQALGLEPRKPFANYLARLGR